MVENQRIPFVRAAQRAGMGASFSTDYRPAKANAVDLRVKEDGR